jgi:hypothetical protein
MPALADQSNPLAVDVDLIVWTGFVFLAIFGMLYFAFAGKRRNCVGAKEARRFSWGKAIVGVVFAILLFNFLALSTVTILPEKHVASEPADAISTVDEHAHFARDQAQLQIEDAKRMVDKAAEMAAATQVDGKNFQEMLDTLNRPRITLDKSAKLTKLSVETKTSPAAEISTADGATKFVVPISDETQESLARSAARLEQMVERVSQMAEQVSDAGTLMGRAMVALNERIDSRDKSEPANDVVVTSAPTVPSPDSKQFADVNVVTVSTSEQVAASDHIQIESPRAISIEIKIDPKKLDRSGLTFEKLKGILGRDGLWRGIVVRFDPNNYQIVVSGEFDSRYLPSLENTLIDTEGWQRKPIHLKDIAEVSVLGDLPLERSDDVPAWISEPPHKVGNSWREVVETEEYSSPEESARAADIYLLFRTYEHLSQLLGNPRSEVSLPSLTFYTESGEIAADGVIIYRAQGNDGEWLDYRLKMMADMGVGVDFVRREMVPEKCEYYEVNQRSAGPMTKLYTMLEFRPSVDNELMRRWEELRRGERFAVVGAGAGSVLGLIGVVFGLLRIDTWTKGYYTKRLFLGVPAAIIGVLALLGLAAG